MAANLFVASTYKPVLDIIAAPARNAGIIRLNTPISSITSSTAASTLPGQRRVVLTGPGAAAFSVDSVIVTVPLGCLKRSSIAFDPPLPERIQQSISSLSYGHLEKVFIRFPRAFWADGEPAGFNFLRPNYAPQTNPNRWHMCCFSLAGLAPPCHQPTLLFYVFGPASAHLTSSARFAAPTTEKGFRQYADFFEPYYSRLAGYDARAADCTPDRIVRTDWSNDEYAGYGSYSNFQVGLADGERDIEVLREGVEASQLWFAGEHTAPVLGLGSVSGAYWSGEGAAAKVIRSLHRNRNRHRDSETLAGLPHANGSATVRGLRA